MRDLRADEARRAFRDLLDEVQGDPAAILRILRYDKPVALIVAADWAQRLGERFSIGGQVGCRTCFEASNGAPGDMAEALAWMTGHVCAGPPEPSPWVLTDASDQ